MSEARAIRKQLKNDPNNKNLQKQYNDLMSKHDIERAKARKAPEVAAKRSNRKASAKRAATITLKAAAAAGTIAAGTYAVNKYLSSHDVRLNGKPVRIGAQTLSGLGNLIRKGKDFMGYIY